MYYPQAPQTQPRTRARTRARLLLLDDGHGRGDLFSLDFGVDDLGAVTVGRPQLFYLFIFFFFWFYVVEGERRHQKKKLESQRLLLCSSAEAVETRHRTMGHA